MLKSYRDREGSPLYDSVRLNKCIAAKNHFKVSIKHKWIRIVTIILILFAFIQYIKQISQKSQAPKYASKPLSVPTISALPQTVIISGMVRDGEPGLLGTLVQIEKFACHWSDYDIVILTNNNKDNTDLLLDVWSKRPIHCDIKQLNLANQGKPFHSKKYIIGYNDTTELPSGLGREDRFVYYRNFILDYVMNHVLNYKRHQLKNDKFSYDLWMMVDFDIQGLEQSRIFEEFFVASHQFNVDVFCVNGVEWTGRYRDSFATVFYDGQWCYEDGAQCSTLIQADRFIQVRSCFGGLSIYKFAVIYESGCKYHTRAELKENVKITHQWFQKQNPKWEDLCEHIAFHDCIYNHYDDEDLKLVISRDSYLYYGFQQYPHWKEEPLLFGASNR